jgi:hypothetical protein
VSERGSYDDPGRVGGRHRGEPSRGILERLIAPLSAVALVAAAVVVLVLIRGHSPGTGPGPGVIVASTLTPGATSTASSTSPGVSATHPPPTPTVRPTHHRKPAWKTAMANVRVYNTTRITGLAHRVAAAIAAKGWTVPAVGNIDLSPSTTTLYYSPNAKDAARHLAHQFSGIGRIQPNREVQIDYPGLTLVLTADWHD